MMGSARRITRLGRQVADCIKLDRIEPDRNWLRVTEKLQNAKAIVDLGCGTRPVPGALVGVDAHIDPRERLLGGGSRIGLSSMNRSGVHFVRSRIDAMLPFRDKEFDFAYSHHAFEHLDDPALACKEMMRIAGAGVIIAPSVFAELAFGRPYHKWLLLVRGGKIWFFRKMPYEDCPFGQHPARDPESGELLVDAATNPFDILLNDGGWYRGREGMERLSTRLRYYWMRHSPILETIFMWEDDFEFSVVD